MKHSRELFRRIESGSREFGSMAVGSPWISEDEDGDGDLETRSQESIPALIEETRSAEVRSHIASEGIVLPRLVRRLRLDLPLHRLISYLRLLRNLCAGEIASQDAFLEVGGPESVVAIILPGELSVPEEAVRLGLQLLGNVAAAGERHRRTLWRMFFPDGFLELSRVKDAVACDALCMILCMCCCSPGIESCGRFDELSGAGAGLSILKEIMSTAHSGDYQGDWIQILLSRVCFEEHGFSILFSQFGSFTFSELKNKNPQFTSEHAFLLRILSNTLSAHPPEPRQISRNFPLAISQVLEEASLAVDFSSRGSSPLPTGSPPVDIVGYSLAILRDLVVDEHAAAPPPEICRLLLRLLRDLEPPSSVRKSLPKSASMVCPYRGFRRDLVAVIGNFCHGRRQIQDEIRRLDGILLMLQQCTIDEENPFLREWGMLAASYLLEGNAENQRIVAELELQGPVQSPEIADLGLRVDVEKKTGRAKLVNV